MRKLMKSNWFKIVLTIVAMLSALGMLFSMFGMHLRANLRQGDMAEGNLQETFYSRLCANYGAEILWGGEHNGGDYSKLEGGNLKYAVYRDGSRIYGTDAEVSPFDYDYTISAARGSSYNYNIYNMFSAMTVEPQISEKEHNQTADIRGLIYDMQTKLFYWNTDEGLFPVSEFYDKNWGTVTLNASGRYYCEDTMEAFQFDTAGTINFNDVPLSLDKPEDCYYDFMVVSEIEEAANQPAEDTQQAEDNVIYETIRKEEYYLGNRDLLVYGTEVVAGGELYSVYMKVAENCSTATFANGTQDYFCEAGELAGILSGVVEAANVVEIISALLFLLSFGLLMAAVGHRRADDEIHLRMTDRIPFAVFAGVCITLVVAGIAVCVEMTAGIHALGISTYIMLEAELMLAWIFVGIFFCMSLAVRIKSHTFWRYTILYYLIKPFRILGRWLKRIFTEWGKGAVKHLGVQWFLLIAFGVLFLVEVLAVAITYSPELLLCIKALEFVGIVLILPQLTKVYEGGERIASGNYEEPIDTRHMIPVLREHATHINSVGDGISQAVQERMKSEHFRTELITNVSHDIKTPLTSIINYVDLMKKENIQDAVLLEYLDVLDRQSSRLKKLIEDLMEASKASTGNLPVNMEVCDARVMLEQAVGEYEEKMKEHELEPVISSPDEQITILADGRHLFRVYDNLMNNICKYAQPGTRVYIDLRKEAQEAVLIFRNTSRYQLNITAEELMQRFTRGDSSRNTEGNGLGLSIAESLTTLMNGKVELTIDGDLFKVTLRFPLSNCDIS